MTFKETSAKSFNILDAKKARNSEEFRAFYIFYVWGMTTFFSFCNLMKKPIHKSSSKSADNGYGNTNDEQVGTRQTAEEVGKGNTHQEYG